METMISIGERLREERDRLGLTQGELAKFLHDAGVAGATRQSQGNYEKGKQQPGALYLAAISRVGVDTLYVLTGKRFVDAAADWQVRTDGSRSNSAAIVEATDRFLSDVQRAGMNVDMPTGAGKATRVLKLVDRNEVGNALEWRDVLALAVDELSALGVSLSGEKLAEFVEVLMELQELGMPVDKKVVATQLRLVS